MRNSTEAASEIAAPDVPAPMSTVATRTSTGAASAWARSSARSAYIQTRAAPSAATTIAAMRRTVRRPIVDPQAVSSGEEPPGVLVITSNSGHVHLESGRRT